MAYAAPAIPILGAPNHPNIRIGSMMILIIAPVLCVINIYMVLPVLCSNLSIVTCRNTITESQHTILRYVTPYSIISGSLVCISIKGLAKSPTTTNSAYVTKLRNIPFCAVAFTLSNSFAPRHLDIRALIPTAVPTPKAIIMD